MRKETEELLTNLSKDFAATKGKGRKSGGMKINKRIFVEALASGESLSNASSLAGSEAKGSNSLSSVGSLILAANPEFRTVVSELIQERQVNILHAMTQEKIEDASLTSQAVAFGILTDKWELLAGRPTPRVQGDMDMDKLEKQQLIAFIMGKFAAGNSANKRLPRG